MILKPIDNLILNDVLEKDDHYLPLSTSDMSKLVAHLPDGEEAFLTIKDNLYTEHIRVENQCGTIVVERGVDSTARRFPRGSCVFFEVSVPLVKWLICNYDCCENSDCICEPVTVNKVFLPKAVVNSQYLGYIDFNGTRPMNFAVSNVPEWLEVSKQGNRIYVGGVATATGHFTFSVSATNCAGASTISLQYSIDVVETA